MTPRRNWTRNVPLFNKNPNDCATVFNEELHAALGTSRVVRLFNHFASSRKDWHGGLGGTSPTICPKFYGNDGLHFNSTGSKLLGALVSRSVFKAMRKEPTQIAETPYIMQDLDRPTASGVNLEPSHNSRPRILFADISSPPPPVSDHHHYPPLPTPVHRVTCNEGSAESALNVLTGFSDAVTKEVKKFTKTEEKKNPIKCKRKSKCTFLSLSN